MAIYKYPKKRRILKTKDFEKVKNEGDKIQNRYFNLFYHRNLNNPDNTRLGIIASRRYGGAVKRNRAKRLIRESFRLKYNKLAPGYDLIFSVRAGADDLSLSAFDNYISDLLKTSGILND